MSHVSQKMWAEFQEYITQYEKDNGVQTIDTIRQLTREFAGSKSPLNNKAAQPIYCTLFMSICYKRNTDPAIDPVPADFNQDNHYDPDGLYPDDKHIQNKLKRFEKQVQKRVLDLINRPR